MKKIPLKDMSMRVIRSILSHKVVLLIVSLKLNLAL